MSEAESKMQEEAHTSALREAMEKVTQLEEELGRGKIEPLKRAIRNAPEIDPEVSKRVSKSHRFNFKQSLAAVKLAKKKFVQHGKLKIKMREGELCSVTVKPTMNAGLNGKFKDSFKLKSKSLTKKLSTGLNPEATLELKKLRAEVQFVRWYATKNVLGTTASEPELKPKGLKEVKKLGKHFARFPMDLD